MCYNKRKKGVIKMKKTYKKVMRKVARFILGFERCPIDYKRSFVKDMQGFFLKVLCTATSIFLLTAILIALS
jgi:hypothetical protein